MNYIRLILPLAAAALFVAVSASCDSSPAGSSARSGETAQQRFQRESQQTFADRARVREWGAKNWRDRLVADGEKDVDGQSPHLAFEFEIDGRPLAVKYTPARRQLVGWDGKVYNIGAIRYPGLPGYAKSGRGAGEIFTKRPVFFKSLIDRRTGEELLPVDFWQILPAGDEIYVRMPTDRESDRKTNLKLSRPIPPVPWSRFDLESQSLVESDVWHAEEISPHHSDRTAAGWERGGVLLQRRDPASTEAVPLTQMEVFPPPGSKLPPLIHDRLTGEPWVRHTLTAGKFTVVQRRTENGEPTARLFEYGYRPLLDTPGETRRFYAYWGYNVDTDKHGDEKAYFLGVRAPGTSEVDNLWLLLDENGLFGAPAGSLGFRPIGLPSHHKYQPNELVNRWAVKELEPRPDGTRWEMVGPQFQPLAGRPRFRDLKLIIGPRWMGADSHRRSGMTQHWLLAGHLPRGTWVVFNVAQLGSPDRPLPRVETQLEVSRFNQLVPALTASYEQKASGVRTQDQHDAAVARRLRQREVERQWQSAFQNRDWSRANALAAERGGDSFYRLVKAMPRPSVAYVREVAEVTDDAAKKAELLEIARTAERRYAEELERHRLWQEQQAEAARLQQQRELERIRQANRAARIAEFAYTPRPVTPSRDHMSPAARERFRANISYSQHAVNMGWYRPYSFGSDKY
jgi:hypothetical protein